MSAILFAAPPGDDYGSNRAEAGALAVNGRLQGVIDYAGDIDWFKVRLETGRSYTFSLEGVLSGAGTIDTSVGRAGLTMWGEGLSAAASVGETRLSYVAAATGDYYLQVGGGGQVGSYTVLATRTSGDLAGPVLTAASVADGASGVGLGGKFTLSFNELVMLGTGASFTLTDDKGVAAGGGSSYRMTALDSTLVLDTYGILAPGATYTLKLAAGAVLDLAGNKLAAPLSYTFSTVATVKEGGPGNDMLAGAGTGLHLAGGAGVDAVYYANPYVLSITQADGQLLVRDYRAAEGDVLTGVERLLFPGYGTAYDMDGHGGQAYRLYQAAFGRTPDWAGVGYWMAQLDQGASLHQVADGFVHSAEFSAKYGAATSDAAFVGLLYQNVLQRGADAAGAAYWLQAMADGLDRATVLVNFSESAENQAAVAKVIGTSFSYQPYF